MENGLLFLLIALADLSLVLLAWRLGKHFLIATIVGNIALTFLFVGKLIPIGGFTTTAAEVFYVSLFIATDILSEHHGKRVTRKAVLMGFVLLVMFTLLGTLAVHLGTIAEGSAVADALAELFAFAPRLMVASLLTYLVVQSFDVWLFHYIKERTGQGKLWLRNNASTLSATLLDSLIFFPLAFAGTVSIEVLFALIATGWLFKVPIALIDTPIIYLSYWVKGKRVPDFQKETGIIAK